MEETSPEEQKTSETVVQVEMPFAVIEGTPMTQVPMDLYIPPVSYTHLTLPTIYSV